jgi:hypothetical protein
MQNNEPAWIKPTTRDVTASGGRIIIRHTTQKKRALGAILALPLLLATGAMAAESPLANEVKAANARFADVAVAKSEGYAAIPCVSGIDGGAMGVHFVNQKLLDDPAVDIAKPEAVLYEPSADGKLTLVAVEYITEKGPAALGSQLFSFTNAPNRYGLPAFYELHVWAWRDNPTGVFSDMNPNVSCAGAPMEMK